MHPRTDSEADKPSPGHYDPQMMVAISVLGPMELRSDGRTLPVPAGKVTQLLIRLALEAGTPVRSERLIDDLWSDSTDSTGRNTLQAKVSALRRALDGAAVVVARSGGYVLQVESASVDALDVIHLATTAKELLAAGDLAGSLATAERALAMYRGEILADAGDGEWLIPHRVRLQEVRRGLVEDRLSARLELGAPASVIGDLEAEVALDPVREGLWVLLITALYRDGRQSDALAAYQRARGHLAEELGLDPGPALQAVEQAVLRRDPALDGSPVTVDGVPPGPAAAPHWIAEKASLPGNLPAMTATLVGRTTELSTLPDLLREHRLVCLLGPGGVGKTRLAVEVARGAHAADGVWLVRLENARTAETLAQALGESLAMNGPTEAMVIDRLRTADALLVLDNCEHLLDAVAELTERLLMAAPRVRVLATSQIPLGLAGEVDFQLDPLPLADSVALFSRRATERRRSFVVDPQTADAIEDVCRSLDGLPLAIELAAARTKALSVQEIARRLDDRFGLLSDTSSRRPERHRTLRTAIEWCYDLLFPDDQRGLWALACFDGGAPLAAAESVAAALGVPTESAMDVIGRLADRSLVAVDIGADGSVRYRLLDSVRAFAAARLAEAGSTDIARAAHLAWLVAASERCRAEQHGPRLPLHVAFAIQERANIDAALAWAADHDPLSGLRLANNFGWIPVILGEGAVAAERLRRALRAAGDAAPAAAQARALAMIGWDEAAADVERARVEAERSTVLADASGDADVIAASRFSLAFVLLQQGRPRQALQVGDDWWATASAPRQVDTAIYCALVGYAALALGETGRLEAACAQAAELPDVDDGWLASQFAANLGRLAQAEHRYADAVTHFGRAAQEAHRVGLAATEGFHLVNVGLSQLQTGDDRSAISTFERAIEMTQTVGLMRVVAVARVRLGQLFRQAGERQAARMSLHAADDWFRSAGGGAESLLAQCLLVAMDAQDGVPDADRRLTALVETADQAEDVDVQILALDGLAASRATAGDAEAAASFLHRSDGLMATAGTNLRDADRFDAQRARLLLADGAPSPVG